MEHGHHTTHEASGPLGALRNMIARRLADRRFVAIMGTISGTLIAAGGEISNENALRVVGGLLFFFGLSRFSKGHH